MKQAFIGALVLLKYYIREHSCDNKTFLFAPTEIVESKQPCTRKTIATSGPWKLIDSTASSFWRENVLGLWEW